VKIAKRIMIVLLVYVGIVVAFESMLGFFQPANQKTLVIATSDGEGNQSDRVVSRLESNGQLYVAANHWPRAWFGRALENPDVQVTLDGAPENYRAIPISGEEHERVDADNRLGLGFRVLTGFPPRYFVRLEKR